MVSTVYGSEGAREALLGQVRQVDDWEPLLDRRFLQRGAYVVPSGEFDWDEYTGSVYTPNLQVSDDPGAWHPDDALFVPMRGSDGRLLGILSVDEPLSGRKPSGDEIDVLVAVSEHAAIAVEAAQETARAKANRDALERLLDVSTRLNETRDADTLLVAGVQCDLGRTRFRQGRRATAERRGPSLHRRRRRVRGRPEHRRPARCRRARAVAAAGVRDRGLLPARARRGTEDPSRPTARLPLAARRPRPGRLAEPLAVRAAARSPCAPHRLHLGRRPDRPAPARRGSPADPPRLREPGDDRSRAVRAVRGDPERVRAPSSADRRFAGGDRRLQHRRSRALVERGCVRDLRLVGGRGDRPRQPDRPRRASTSASSRPSRASRRAR